MCGFQVCCLCHQLQPLVNLFQLVKVIYCYVKQWVQRTAGFFSKTFNSDSTHLLKVLKQSVDIIYIHCFFVLFIGHRKCRELWPDEPIEYEKIFNLFLDMFLLVLPLFVLFATYFMITRTLWQGIQTERDVKNQLSNYSKCLCKY